MFCIVTQLSVLAQEKEELKSSLANLILPDWHITNSQEEPPLGWQTKNVSYSFTLESSSNLNKLTLWFVSMEGEITYNPTYREPISARAFYFGCSNKWRLFYSPPFSFKKLVEKVATSFSISSPRLLTGGEYFNYSYDFETELEPYLPIDYFLTIFSRISLIRESSLEFWIDYEDPVEENFSSLRKESEILIEALKKVLHKKKFVVIYTGCGGWEEMGIFKL